MGMVQGADRGVTAAYWQVSPVSDGTTDTVTELLTGISQAGLISQSSNPLTLPPDYCCTTHAAMALTAAERYQSSVINISLFYVASKSKS